MTDDNYKEQSLEIISTLLETINWLGGNSYEMECIQADVEKATKFLNEHKPEVITEESPENHFPPNHSSFKLGLYCYKLDKTKTVEAQNKHHARNLLRIQHKLKLSDNDIECLISKDFYKKNGLYCLKSDKTKTVEAQNKLHAKNLLNASTTNEVECLVQKGIYTETTNHNTLKEN
jgi:hypothetical protein